MENTVPRTRQGRSGRPCTCPASVACWVLPLRAAWAGRLASPISAAERSPRQSSGCTPGGHPQDPSPTTRPTFLGPGGDSPPPSLEVRRVEVHPRVGARSCAGTTEGDRGCLLRGADPPRPAPRWGRASQLPRLVQKLRKRPPPRRDSAHAARGAGFRSRDWSRRCQGGRIPAPGRESRGAARGPHRARR